VKISIARSNRAFRKWLERSEPIWRRDRSLVQLRSRQIDLQDAWKNYRAKETPRREIASQSWLCDRQEALRLAIDDRTALLPADPIKTRMAAFKRIREALDPVRLFGGGGEKQVSRKPRNRLRCQ